MQKVALFEFVMSGDAGFWLDSQPDAAFDNMAVLNSAFNARYILPNQLFIAMQNWSFVNYGEREPVQDYHSSHATVSSGHGTRQPDDPFCDPQRSATWITTTRDPKTTEPVQHTANQRNHLSNRPYHQLHMVGLCAGNSENKMICRTPYLANPYWLWHFRWSLKQQQYYEFISHSSSADLLLSKRNQARLRFCVISFLPHVSIVLLRTARYCHALGLC